MLFLSIDFLDSRAKSLREEAYKPNSVLENQGATIYLDSSVTAEFFAALPREVQSEKFKVLEFASFTII